MKYSIATIRCNELADWQTDLLMQELADMGFDSFEQDEGVLRAYIPSDLLAARDAAAIQADLSSFPIEVTSVEACEDANWNAVWEASHVVEELPLGVRIVPHCAFGAGHHETTAMLINELMTTELTGKTVFDHGTGTGVLAIFSKRLGAEYVLADDIDENAVNNARENAAANSVEIDVRLSGSDFLTFDRSGSDSMADRAPERTFFDLIIANIHRNILLQQMADYAARLATGGELWLSGFYEQDMQVLIDAASACGLTHVATRSNAEWRMLRFCKK